MKTENNPMTDNRPAKKDDPYKTSRLYQDKDTDADPEMLDRSKMIDSAQKH